jgi:hypothetical protein
MHMTVRKHLYIPVDKATIHLPSEFLYRTLSMA